MDLAGALQDSIFPTAEDLYGILQEPKLSQLIRTFQEMRTTAASFVLVVLCVVKNLLIFNW